jgi:hypothetical protein
MKCTRAELARGSARKGMKVDCSEYSVYCGRRGAARAGWPWRRHPWQSRAIHRSSSAFLLLLLSVVGRSHHAGVGCMLYARAGGGQR